MALGGLEMETVIELASEEVWIALQEPLRGVWVTGKATRVLA